MFNEAKHACIRPCDLVTVDYIITSHPTMDSVLYCPDNKHKICVLKKRKRKTFHF